MEPQTYARGKHPRDLIYRHHVEFDGPIGMACRRLPIDTSDAFRHQEGTYVDVTHRRVLYESALLWTTPPAVIQVPLQEAVGIDRQPSSAHPECRQERSREHSCSDDRYRDRANPDRWIQIMEETLTKDERPVDSRCQREARREGSPRSGNEEDLQKVIDRLSADKGADRYKTRNRTLSQSGTRESCEPYSRRTDPNEHRKRRHNYDAGSSHTPDRERHDQTGSDRAYRQMMRWIADDPTRLAEAQKDMARWKEYLAEAVKNPVFPFFASMTCK